MTSDVLEQCADSATASTDCASLTTQAAAELAACALKKARELAEQAVAADDPNAIRAHLLITIADGWRAIATHVPLSRS